MLGSSHQGQARSDFVARAMVSLVLLVAASIALSGGSTAAAQERPLDPRLTQAAAGSSVGLSAPKPDGPSTEQVIEVHPECTGEASPPFMYDNEVGANATTSCGTYVVDEAYAFSDLQVDQGFGIYDTVDTAEVQEVSTQGVIAITSTEEVECSGTRNYRHNSFHWVFDNDRKYEGPGTEDGEQLYC